MLRPNRRLGAIAWAVVLVMLVGATPAGATGNTGDSFMGYFELEVEWTGEVLMSVAAKFSRPTERRLVPGTYDTYGVPGNPVRETHATIGHVDFWFDENNPAPGMGGSNVAFASGVQCSYMGPGESLCQPFAVMFIDVLDPTHPDQVALAEWDEDADEWAFDLWLHAGKGAFLVQVAATP